MKNKPEINDDFEDELNNYCEEKYIEGDCMDDIDYLDICSASDCTGMLVSGPGYVDDIEAHKNM